MSEPVTTELQVEGMTCNNCARHVTEAIQGVPNVRSAMVSLERRRATVRWAAGGAKSVPALLAAVAKAGYEAQEVVPDEGAARPAQNHWQWNLIMGLGVTGVLLCGEWIFDLGMTPWFRWAAFALAGVVQIFCGAQFYAGAWRQLEAGQSNMDTLVALGSTTAFGYSAWALMGGLGGHVYFMEAAAIISLVSFGHWIEARVSEKASGALKALLNLAPQTARRVSPRPEPKAGPAQTMKPHGALTTSDFAKTLGAFLPLPGGPSPTGVGEGARRPVGGCGDQNQSCGEGRGEGGLPPFSSSTPALKSLRSGIGGQGAGDGRFDLKSLSFSQPAIAHHPSPIASRQSTMETEIPVAELKINDRVALRPGDRVPVDGVVLDGESAVDEAMLTGESAPVDKKAGSELFAGTVNLNGSLAMRVTATGEATALAHIVAAVQRAQTSRADIQRLGDRISNVFVPVIVAVALAAGLWWGLAPASAGAVHEFLARFFWHTHLPAGAAAGFIAAAAVLIIACPCAMGLATPAAIMAGANAAARRGILIRDGVALEKAGGITAVIFDKTGTLTVGKPAVAALWPNGTGVPVAPPLAFALARHSTHPVSQAVAAYCETTIGSNASPNVTATDWREIRGSGIEAESATDNAPPALLRFGSLSWLRESGVNLSAGEKFVADWSGQGATVVGLAAASELLGLFAVRDSIKAHAAAVVARLRREHLRVYLLTGDNGPTATAVARAVGIAPENVFAEARPEQKAEFVRKLQAQGERVAFVGDGINDAPALTQADLGIAVSRASDVAREAADIILLKSEIEAVPEALGLARATLRTIKQNLFWAFFYNALGVPLAALGFISPVFCAAAMGFSDLIVIGNALRLLRWRQPAENSGASVRPSVQRPEGGN
ncbi:MAG: cation-translocating P-type ATPase [Verrucomicrobiota bacterium]|jgi:Cu+-exporting ATPase